jgi:hypothetical protein
MLVPQCGPKWIAAQLTDTRLTPERVEGANKSLEQKHEEGPPGPSLQAMQAGEIVRGHGPLDSNGRQEKPRASREPQGGAGKAPEASPCRRRENRVRAPEVAA